MTSYTHKERMLTLTTPLGANVLLLESLRGSEGISELFDLEFEVLATKGTAVPAANLIGKRVTAEIQYADNGTKRPFNGMVASLEELGGDFDFNSYRLRVVPALWLLTLNTQTRVFQNETVLEILKKVLTAYSITPKDSTQEKYIALDYCTQYRETDLEFIARLMEQHGIFYYFTHTASDHTMVLADTSAQLEACPGKSKFRYAPNWKDRAGLYDMVLDTFTSRSSLNTGQHTFWDYRFTQFATTASNPKSSASKADAPANSHEAYDYADGAASYQKTEAGDGNVVTQQTKLQEVARDIADAQTVQVAGTSNASVLQSGFKFSLTEYPLAEKNTEYLVTRVEHRARQLPPFRSQQQSGAIEPYQGSFVAQPASLKYRSPRRTPKPRVQGVVTGKVVVPSGEESYLDKYGRVCVQFWWDRQRKPNTTDNTLLRVAQSWAGKGWGTYFWPRIGDEVLIDFLDGDPDAPIVVGSLYNGVNMPKYDPTSEYTRAGILTRSSKDGGAANANELRFDDLKGSEQIFLNAEKDFDVHVENDWHTKVDKDRHLTVGGDQFTQIAGERHAKVTKDAITEIDGDLHLAVQGKRLEQTTGDKSEKISGSHMFAAEGTASANYSQALNQKVGMNYSLQVGQNQFNKAGMLYVVDSGQEVHIKGGMTVVMEAGMGLCLSGPGGFISIDPTGVTIQGLMVKINSGGASLQGSPGMPESPQPPTAPKSPTAPTQPADDPRAGK